MLLFVIIDATVLLSSTRILTDDLYCISEIENNSKIYTFFKNVKGGSGLQSLRVDTVLDYRTVK